MQLAAMAIGGQDHASAAAQIGRAPGIAVRADSSELELLRPSPQQNRSKDSSASIAALLRPTAAGGSSSNHSKQLDPAVTG